MAKTTRTDGRSSGARTVEERPGQARGSARRPDKPGALGREPHEGESAPINAQQETRREIAEQAVKDANEGGERESPRAARARRISLGHNVDPELENRDTSNMPGNNNSPSQQPTMLESKGGTEQPHPTMAPRAARSGAGLLPPPGRSHDSSLDAGTGKPAGDAIRVRATQTGYYNHIRRREGDVFTLVAREGLLMQPVMKKAAKGDDSDAEQAVHPRTGEPMFRQVRGRLSARDQFSENWMEVVSDDETERTSTSRDAIKKRHDELLGALSGRPNDEDVTGAAD